MQNNIKYLLHVLHSMSSYSDHYRRSLYGNSRIAKKLNSL